MTQPPARGQQRITSMNRAPRHTSVGRPAQSSSPRGNARPAEPATTLRTLETAADDNVPLTTNAGVLPPISVSEAYTNRVPAAVGVISHSPAGTQRDAVRSWLRHGPLQRRELHPDRPTGQRLPLEAHRITPIRRHRRPEHIRPHRHLRRALQETAADALVLRVEVLAEQEIRDRIRRHLDRRADSQLVEALARDTTSLEVDAVFVAEGAPGRRLRGDGWRTGRHRAEQHGHRAYRPPTDSQDAPFDRSVDRCHVTSPGNWTAARIRCDRHDRGKTVPGLRSYGSGRTSSPSPHSGSGPRAALTRSHSASGVLFFHTPCSRSRNAGSRRAVSSIRSIK